MHKIDSGSGILLLRKKAQRTGHPGFVEFLSRAVARAGAGVHAKLPSQTFVALNTIQHSTCESANRGAHVPSLVLVGSYNCDLSGVIG